MILFEKDIKEQQVYIDVTTTNLSFIRMSYILKMMGIKNNKFFLALHDIGLKGIDPHNLPKGLSPSERLDLTIRIAKECKINVWYFLREVCRVQAASGDGSSQFILNRYNLALTWCLFNNLDTFSTILRQIGKTTGIIALNVYLMYIKESYFDIGFISKDADGVQEAVKRVKVIRDMLPDYLINKLYKDGDNKEGLTYESLHNSFRTFIAQKSIIQAKKLGRGLSMPMLNKDEFAFQDNNHIIFPSALAATTTAREQAHKKGSIGALCIATTAADPDTPAGKYAFKIKEECMYFNDHFYDIGNRHELVDILKKGSTRQMFYITYNHLQLGKTDEWLNDVITRVGCDEDEADRDFRNIWKRGSSGGALSKEIKAAITRSLKDPVYTEFVDGFVFNYQVTKEQLEDVLFKNKPFIIGMDSAENIGKDFSTLFMIDPLNMKPIMSFRCNNSNLNKFAKFIFELLLRFKRAVWVPERNHVGAMILDTVIDLLQNVGENPYKRIFNTVVDDAKSYRDVVTEDDITGSEKGKFGFRTHGGATGRKLLYTTVFEEAMNRNKDQIGDMVLIEQLKELILKNGRVDHPPGKHDDMVIAYLLCCYFVMFAKNIRYYGVESGEIIDFDIISNNDGSSPQINKEEFIELFKQMKELEMRITQTASPLLQSKLEMDFRNLKHNFSKINVSEDIMTRTQLSDNVNEKNFMTDIMKRNMQNRMLTYL